MIDIRTASAMYAYPDIVAVNTIGHLIVAYLCIYLMQNFFEPKKREHRSVKELLMVGTLFAATLFTVDWVMDNQFYFYMGTMILFPFIYACMFFRGKTVLKAMVSVIFFTMLMSIEQLSIEATFYLAEDYLLDIHIWRLIFFLRRTVGVGLLYFIVKVLMIDVMHDNTKMVNSYWYFMAGVCLTDYLVIKYTMRPSNNYYAKRQGMILTVCCVLVPLICYYMISLIVRLGEAGKTAVAQNTWISAQEKYLAQMEEMQESMHRFRHDYQSHLFCMDALLEDKRYGELHEYLEKLHHQPMDGMNLVPFTENRALNLVLNQKKRQADKAGVDFLAEVGTEVEPKSAGRVQLYDLNALISNLCDNAIEAAAKVKNGQVRFCITKKKAYIKVEIENSTAGNVLEENPEFETDKEQKELHGFGLKIIRNIVETYEGMYETESNDHSLKTSILLLNE